MAQNPDTAATTDMQQPSAPDMNDMEFPSEGGEVDMVSLLSLAGTRCFTIIQDNRNELGIGELNCCALDDDTLMLYIPNIFQYAITKQFPSLRSSKYSFVFPGQNKMCFGLIFPISTPNDDLEMFEGLLLQYSDYTINEVVKIETNKELTTDEKTAEKGKKVAKYIDKGTKMAQKGIKKGTSVASKGIRRANLFIKSKIKSRKDIEVSEKTKDRIHKARQATKGAVKVSKAAVIGAKVMAAELASAASDAISKTKYGQKITQSESGKMQAAKYVGKATISGTILIIDELKDAALLLVAEIADCSADVAGFKYGEQVGVAAQDIAEVVKDGSVLITNVGQLGYKSIAATVIPNAAVDVMSNEEEKEEIRKQLKMKSMKGADKDVQIAATMASEMAITEIKNASDEK